MRGDHVELESGGDGERGRPTGRAEARMKYKGELVMIRVG